jgi:hypothetical protein
MRFTVAIALICLKLHISWQSSVFANPPHRRIGGVSISKLFIYLRHSFGFDGDILFFVGR